MRPLRRALPALLLVLAACGSDGDGTAVSEPTSTTAAAPSSSTTTDTTPACPAGALAGGDLDAQPALTEAAAATRQAIVDAALACDFERLEELSLAGDGEFTYSFGAGGGAGLAEHLRAREADGEELSRLLVETFRLPVRERQLGEGGGRYFAWERADPLDYRAGITEAGDWMYFVAGD